MEKTIIEIVSRVEEKLGKIESDILHIRETNESQHQAITRRLDISNGRLAKGEDRDDEIIKRIEGLEQSDCDITKAIEETNIIPLTQWMSVNRKFLKLLVGFIITLGAVFSAAHFFIEDIFHIVDKP